MSLDLIEGGLDAIIAFFTAQLPAKVTALNAAYADAITLADITNVYDVEQVEAEAQNFPFIEVLGVRTDVLSENGASMLTGHNIAIICTVEDDSSRSTLRRRCYRYARAIIELLKDARTNASFTGYSILLKGGAIDFNPVRWTRNKSRVIADVIVGCQLVSQEVYP